MRPIGASDCRSIFDPDTKGLARSGFAILAIVASYAVYAVIHGGESQSDFWVYWDAARAFLRGVDFYDLRGQPSTAATYVASADAPNPSPGYLYPPLSILFFTPFALLPLQVAVILWVFLKCAALVATMRIWLDLYPWFNLRNLATVSLLMLGYDSAVFVDLITGNIAIFEHYLIWLSLRYALANKAKTFVLAILLLAQFKVTVIVLLGFLLILDPRLYWREFVGGCLLFALTAAANALFLPGPFASFVEKLSSFSEPSSSVLSLFKELQVMLASHTDLQLPSSTATLVWVASGVLIAGLTLAMIAYHHARHDPIDRDSLAMLTLTLFVLVSPRLKAYSLLVMIMPTLYALRRSSVVALFTLMLVAIAVPRGGVFSFLSPAAHRLSAYQPLLFISYVWLLLVLRLIRVDSSDPVGRGFGRPLKRRLPAPREGRQSTPQNAQSSLARCS